MSDELLKRYAGAGAEGAGYAAEEDAVVTEGLEEGAPDVAAEDLERWGTSPAAAAAYADLAHHDEGAAVADADAARAEGAAEESDADSGSTGLGARVKKLFGG